jgi:hypothetical protein
VVEAGENALALLLTQAKPGANMVLPAGTFMVEAQNMPACTDKVELAAPSGTAHTSPPSTVGSLKPNFGLTH